MIFFGVAPTLLAPSLAELSFPRQGQVRWMGVGSRGVLEYLALEIASHIQWGVCIQTLSQAASIHPAPPTAFLTSHPMIILVDGAV